MAALTPVASVEALVSVIEKSGLLSPDAMAKVREAAAKASDPKALARDLVKSGALTKWQAEQLINGYHRLLVGNYKLLAQIATSPTGRVYLAEHAQMGRRHSLKVLARRLASNPDAVKHFLDTARNACSLDHRNVSHVYDVNQDRIGHFIVMEHVEGEDLEQLVERTGRVNLAQALDFVRQAAEGLAHAHANGVVHGDLKPANLLRDHSGTIKILEFGQAEFGAKPETEDADESVETASLAAVIFQAPELRGDGEEADIACDVYSLGSVLCFLLTAKAARDAAAAVELLEEVPEMSAEAVGLCRRLMAEKPAERPGSAEEVLAAIGVLVRHVSSSAKAKSEEKSSDSQAVKAEAAKEKTSASSTGPAKEKKPSGAKATEDVSTVPPVIVTEKIVTEKIVTEKAVAAAAIEPPPFSIKTRGRIGKKPRKSDGESSADTEKTGDSTLPWNAGQAPLVLAGAIGGGGMLALALGIAVICVMTLLGGGAPVAQAPMATAAAVAETAPPAATEQPESNPEAPALEANPEVAAAAPPASPVPVAAAAATGEPVAQPAVAAAAPANPATDVKTIESSAPAGASTSTKSVTTTVAAVPAASPTPEPKTAAAAEKKVEVAVAPKTEPASAPAKAAPKAAPAANPFVGFAKAVSLPNLPDAPDSAATSALAPAELGPCKVDEKTTLTIWLLGGDTAIRNSKQKFELQPKPESKREWNFVLSGGPAPVHVAALAAEEGQLLFHWTEEALKQPAVAKQLCNCGLNLGPSRQVVALRQVEHGAPLAVDIEKPNVSVKWNIGELPAAKQLFVELRRADGFKIFQQEPKSPVDVGDSIVIGTGPSDKSVPLQFKLNTSSTSNAIEVRLQTTVRLKGSESRPYRRRDLVNMQPQSVQELTRVKSELDSTKAKRPTLQAEKDAQKATVDRLANELAAVNTVIDQLRYVVDFSGATEGQAKLHFRVYYLAGDAKIDLLKTEEEQPAEKAK